MFVDGYDIGPIRPPSESGSLLIRVMRNCPWNKCEFCMVYKGEKFELKPLEEVLSDIDQAERFFGPRAAKIQHAFLQDANAIMVKTPDLVKIIKYMKEKFPGLERITTYGRNATIAKKPLEDLVALKEAGLSRIHIGMETGYGPLLEYIRKGCTPEQQIEAGKKVKAAGISLSEYIMPGLGGKGMSEGHAMGTARVLNEVNPDFIRVRSTSVRPDTPLFEKMTKGEFTPLTDEETVGELRLLIDNLSGIDSVIVSDHMMNLLQEVEGKLPDDKNHMLKVIDGFLNLSEEDKILFQVGSRLGIFRRLSDMDIEPLKARGKELLEKIQEEVKKRGSGFTIQDFIQEALHGII